MIDGIGLRYLLPMPYNNWLNSLPNNVSLFSKMNETTGEIKIKQRGEQSVITRVGKWQNWDIKVSTISNQINENTYLYIKGSLHKSYFNGTNYQQFTYNMLQAEISKLSTCLNMATNKVQITSLEVGVNIMPTFNVDAFIRLNIVQYSSAKHITKDYKDFAKCCTNGTTQYSVKIYDKGVQNKLGYQLLRIEKKYLKMQPLKKYDIRYLSDLEQRHNVEPLLNELCCMWNDVLVFDIDDVLSLNIKSKDVQFLTECKNPNYWHNLLHSSRYRYHRYQRKMNDYLSQFGNKYHKDVSALIVNEWQALIKSATVLPSGEIEKCNSFTKWRSIKSATVLPYR